ncbi:glycosyltransferase family 4 protein [Fimbriimonas ginsengisoli]|uniref:Group 1 glycosyl transferase n=1 Tax=Fimbriimonas ginsengisoli Gsoil 348 TaxID=661478 RepID=A0A068NPN3_FIMGI|nr:glycosyltransferase family 4 protein [Fimbriimonas ginsengisoli]AIE85337.1 group 1 glycosyl transferase [Fimbriimonas ginsengisoli Gsoil 348]
MRVLFVNRADADTRPGGDTVQMHETAKGLRRMGVEVEERLGPQSEEAYGGYDVVHLFNLQTPEFTLVEAEKAKSAGRKLAVSTIYWDFSGELLLAQSARWARIASLTGRPAALWAARKWSAKHAAEPRRQVSRIIELADVLLPNSQEEAVHLRRLTPSLRTVAVVPNGIDADRFDPTRVLDLPKWAKDRGVESGAYLLVAARVDPHKNQVTFCRALRGFSSPIVLAGQVTDANLVRECEESGAIFVGSLSGDELVASYSHAKVHALPSFRETPGLASLEAAAMGCAIVSTDVGSAREYFGDEADYCSPHSADSMRIAVASAWGAGAPVGLSARIREKYTWDAAAKATLAAYERL